MRVRTGAGGQRGFALMGLVALLVAGVLFLAVQFFSSGTASALREKATEDALVQARDALMGYLVRLRELNPDTATGELVSVYGFLPLPDLGTSRNQNVACTLEGCDAANFSGNAVNLTVIGRFPWRKLGLPALRDGHGECLWYVVSGSHQRIQQTTVMNWDTLGQLDVMVANGGNALSSALASAHDRPVAIIFSPGPPIGGQNRSNSSTDAVTDCGGNYDVANYLDPATADALGGVSNYFAASANNATGDTATANKPLSMRSTVYRKGDGTLWPNTCPAGTDCTLAANDRGLEITPDYVFGALRNSANFRADINSMLDRIVGCLRDQLASGGSVALGADNNDCYGRDSTPKGYYPHYRELLFTKGGGMSVNGETCGGVLLFASQRGTKSPPPTDAGESAVQLRTTAQVSATNPASNKNWPANYLEDVNLSSFGGSGTTFSGPANFERVSATQAISRDIVRCIPNTASLTTVNSPVATGAGPLATYSPSTGTLTLGQEVTSSLEDSVAGALYGCAWRPDTHAMGGGFRSYFNFRIVDSLNPDITSPRDGFTFAMVDGDNNSTTACGAARQHLGYSGNNGATPFVAAPKIGFEVDLRTQGTFTPSASNTLNNGRNDISYAGGHVALAYWGGETSIPTFSLPPCVAPRVAIAGFCYLPQEEDDNVHGQTASTRSGFSTPPANPTAPGAGYYKLDPGLNSTPINQNIHVRIEVNRNPASYTLPKVRLATTTSVDLAAPSSTIDIDGVVPSTGDRILVKNQPIGAEAENGIYLWAGADKPLSRATDADEAKELAGLLVEVEQGRNNARQIFRQTSTSLATVGTDALRWANAHVKVATTGNILISYPGVTAIDGITLGFGDRVLVKNQTTDAENGIYLWIGPNKPLTRATDADTAAKRSGLVVQVRQGSEASAWWGFDGSTWQRRTAVHVATQAAINLAAPGDTIDGKTLVSGDRDRVLVKDQANSAQNGIYVWNGAASAMTRATDADTAAKLVGALVYVREGSDIGRTFRQTSLGASEVIETKPIQWASIDPSPKFSINAWVLVGDSSPDQIAAMKNTTRPMSLLYPGFAAQVRDAPTIPYPFRNVRLGFTVGQRTSATDQTISVNIKDSSTTWLE